MIQWQIAVCAIAETVLSINTVCSDTVCANN